jgi:mono/diheme cytochrome c family protein
MKYGSLLLGLATIILAACRSGAGPGVVQAPEQVTSFPFLFARNCAGCHGERGKGGAAVELADPLFLAIADDAAIRRTIAGGVPGTPMPAFAQGAGGMLTDQQIDAVVRGIRSWADPGALRGSTLPPYTALTPGDPERGEGVYQVFCLSCHGAEGTGGRAHSIVDGSYLALVSDQDLRMNVILGRPSQGAPDWRGDVPGRAMSDQEISDVVAWLSARRPAAPGQPYPATTMNRNNGGMR